MASRKGSKKSLITDGESASKRRLVAPVMVGAALVMDSLAMAVGPAGALPTSGTLEILTGDGTSGASTSGQPASGQSIGYPQGLAVDSQGDVYFVDDSNLTVDEISATGVLTIIAGLGSKNAASANPVAVGDPYSVAVDSSGDVFFTSGDYGTVDEITDPLGTDTVTVIAGSGSTNADSPNDVSVSVAGAVALDSSGDVFFTDWGNGTVDEITDPLSADDVTVVAGAGSTNASSGSPVVIGDLWPDDDMVNNLVVNASGDVFFTDRGHGTVDAIHDPLTSDVVTIVAGDGAPSPVIVDSPQGLAIDGAGNLYVADLGMGRVDEIEDPLSADNITVIAGPGAANASASLDPYGVAVDTSGNVYVTTWSDGNLDEISDPLGSDQLTVLASSSSITNFAPIYVELGGDNLYFTDNYNDEIDEVPLLAPTPPVDLLVSAGTTSVTGTWAPSSGATSYTCTLLYAYNDPSSFTVTSSSPTCTFTGLSSDTTYGISVVANYPGQSSSASVGFATTGGSSSGAPGSSSSTPTTTTTVPTTTTTTPTSPTWSPNLDVYFAFNRAVLTSADKAALNALARKVVANGIGALTVTGYTDPRGTQGYNLVLSEHRANVTATYLRGLFRSLGAQVSITATGDGILANGQSYAQQRVVRITG